MIPIVIQMVKKKIGEQIETFLETGPIPSYRYPPSRPRFSPDPWTPRWSNGQIWNNGYPFQQKREKDFDMLIDPHFMTTVREEGIKLTSYSEQTFRQYQAE